MLVTDYTTFDEVRAALGVSEDELEDAQLTLPMYEAILQVELEDIHISLPATYQTVQALTTRTDEQNRFVRSARLFATYAMARQLTTVLPMFSPEQVTDGKAAVRRTQQDNPYKTTIEAVAREYSRFKKYLEQSFAVINSASADTAQKVFLSVVAPASDPITGG